MEGPVKKRKSCLACHGRGNVHHRPCPLNPEQAAENNVAYFMEPSCTCGYPPCEACQGTGIRARHKDANT